MRTRREGSMRRACPFSNICLSPLWRKLVIVVLLYGDTYHVSMPSLVSHRGGQPSSQDAISLMARAKPVIALTHAVPTSSFYSVGVRQRFRPRRRPVRGRLET